MMLVACSWPSALKLDVIAVDAGPSSRTAGEIQALIRDVIKLE
jgi:hypothetical protein